MKVPLLTQFCFFMLSKSFATPELACAPNFVDPCFDTRTVLGTTRSLLASLVPLPHSVYAVDTVAMPLPQCMATLVFQNSLVAAPKLHADSLANDTPIGKAEFLELGVSHLDATLYCDGNKCGFFGDAMQQAFMCS